MRHSSAPADRAFLIYCVIIIIFGLLALSSASVAPGIDRFNDPYFFIKRQLLFGFLPGLVAFFALSKISYTAWKRWTMPFFVGISMLLIAVFIPGIGSNHGTGSQSWIAFGNFSFQPVEIAKLGLILFLAGLLARMGERIGSFKEGFLPALCLGIAPILLVIAQPDIGTAAVLFAIVFCILFLARANMMHLVLLLLASVIAFGVLIIIAPYRAARLTTFLHPELDPQGIGYQINQASVAIGSGGLFGLGLGHSRQKFQYLPEVHADSIFAIIAEELGFIITVGFLIILILFIYRGYSIGMQAPDAFGRLVVGGIMSWIMVQSIFNIGAMVGILPLTGLPLPFVSHGGTALMVGMAAMGIVANISKHV